MLLVVALVLALVQQGRHAGEMVVLMELSQAVASAKERVVSLLQKITA